VQRSGEIQQDSGAVGFELQGTGEKHDSVSVPAELRERDAQQLLEISIVRRTTK
jgi:hypothetical protein